ncbi:hypothetical protein A3A84_00655 [Candidatus Collierbacteria bacterium RIFCSPLOWO2_01_FULL_50_23]|uniref:AB hydrolase-1 domain-containing protein n=1 Tax=Candidatus Collierbacteria bacterium RIFCSPHIGHO2_01_FULL_50_25 TaxID=1817722 RepID=A0A1F5EWX7_9BACT|nr:MAG: hypothetical protein A2703_02030 [Candidatus Collierbacteria bacterium RIFCSPHIGHO2_01_FULL_50_25]OGD74752.1 MAG: hypothetical protein A3A84_00655 [Candidatus Collierbacteria bacterium RIFCSPLOWO2_01_FULL_50_23]
MQTVINGVLTNYEVVNPKAEKDILLLHGWASNAAYWLPEMKLLDSSFCYYLLDLPGFGGTQNMGAHSGVPEYREFVKNFIDKLKLKEVIIIGHSFGGQIAADLAIKYPHLPRLLIFISPAIVRVRGPKIWLKIGVTKVVKPIIRFFPTHVMNFILGLYAPKDYIKANDYQKTVLHQILKYNLGVNLHSIKVPTEIVWGSEDKVIPYVGKYLIESIPQARLHVVYGTGHLPHLTHPAKLAAVLNQILLKQ